MNSIEKAYYKAIRLGLMEKWVPDYTGNFKLDKPHFKKAWIKHKNENPGFKLL